MKLELPIKATIFHSTQTSLNYPSNGLSWLVRRQSNEHENQLFTVWVSYFHAPCDSRTLHNERIFGLTKLLHLSQKKRKTLQLPETLVKNSLWNPRIFKTLIIQSTWKLTLLASTVIDLNSKCQSLVDTLDCYNCPFLLYFAENKKIEY